MSINYWSPTQSYSMSWYGLAQSKTLNQRFSNNMILSTNIAQFMKKKNYSDLFPLRDNAVKRCHAVNQRGGNVLIISHIVSDCSSMDYVTCRYTYSRPEADFQWFCSTRQNQKLSEKNFPYIFARPWHKHENDNNYPAENPWRAIIGYQPANHYAIGFVTKCLATDSSW